jgi:hypothetical protein
MRFWALISKDGKINNIRIPGVGGDFSVLPIFFSEEDARKAIDSMPPMERTIEEVAVEVTRPIHMHLKRGNDEE